MRMNIQITVLLAKPINYIKLICILITFSQYVKCSRESNFITISRIVVVSSSLYRTVSRYPLSALYSWRCITRFEEVSGTLVAPLVAEVLISNIAFTLSNKKNRLFHGAKCLVTDFTTIFLDNIHSASLPKSMINIITYSIVLIIDRMNENTRNN